MCGVGRFRKWGAGSKKSGLLCNLRPRFKAAIGRGGRAGRLSCGLICIFQDMVCANQGKEQGAGKKEREGKKASQGRRGCKAELAYANGIQGTKDD